MAMITTPGAMYTHRYLFKINHILSCTKIKVIGM